MIDFLYGRPSFLDGAARILDLFGVFRHHDRLENDDEVDARALYDDFRIVGLDLEDAMRRYESERRFESGQGHSQEIEVSTSR